MNAIANDDEEAAVAVARDTPEVREDSSSAKEGLCV